MNPLEQHLRGLALPAVPDGWRDKLLVEAGRRQGEQSARKWQVLSLALALGLGSALIPLRPAIQPPALQPAPTAPAPIQVVIQPDTVEQEQAEDEPWLARFLKQRMVDRELQLLEASRITPQEPVTPPPWAITHTEGNYLQRIDSLIQSEEK
jgi:hypothetical protein